jgi:hypothetical protein
MTATASATIAAEQCDLSLDGELAERRRAANALYDAEVALHIARQTHVDEWIAAAADRLHEAILGHARAGWTPSPVR